MRIEMVKTVGPVHTTPEPADGGCVGHETGTFDSVRWWRSRPAAERLMAVEERRGWTDPYEARP